MSELMERLARANPTPTGEPLTAEESCEADAVLERILADSAAVETPVRRPVPVLRRVAPAAGLLAVVAIASVVAIDLVDSEEGSGGIVERAAAAVSEPDVIYTITERQTGTLVSLEPGAAQPKVGRSFGRTWIWPGGDRSRFLMYPHGRRGRLGGEITVDGNRIAWFHPDLNRIDVMKRPWPDWPARPDHRGYPDVSPLSDPGTQLRAHVDEGRLRAAGRTTVRGRTAYRLVSDSRRLAGEEPGRETVTYLVDARTYLPLEMRTRIVADLLEGRQLVRWRVEYLRYERLPLTEENRALLEMRPHPGARVRGP